MRRRRPTRQRRARASTPLRPPRCTGCGVGPCGGGGLDLADDALIRSDAGILPDSGADARHSSARGSPTALVGLGHDLHDEGGVRSAPARRAGPPGLRAAGLAQGDLRGRGPAARLPRAHRGPAQEGRPRREHARRARRLPPVASRGVDHDGRGRAGARGRRRAHELLRRRLPGGPRAVLARRRPRPRAARPSCCGRACRAASSRRWPRRRSPSSSPSRSARRCPRPPTAPVAV